MNRTTLRLTRLEDRCVPAVVNWDGHPDAGGTSADNHWTTATNWVGDHTPQPGDTLQFPAGAQQLTNVNDFPAGTSFDLFVGGAGYQISGNAVTLLHLGADLPAGGTSTLALPMGGGYLSKGGAGTLVLTGTGTPTGVSTIDGGAVSFDGTWAGPVMVGGGGAAGGSGTVGPFSTYFGLTGGTSVIAPGPGSGGVGALTTGDLSLTGNVTEFRVSFANAGGGLVADRLAVHGTVQLGGQLVADAAGTLNTGTVTIIDNDGTDPVQGTFRVPIQGDTLSLPEGGIVTVGDRAARISYHGGDGNDVTLTVVDKRTVPAFAVGAGAGGGPQVNVYFNDGTLVRSFNAYDPAFRGGVRVATADLNGDGIKDVITAAGPGGGPHVRIFDGATGAVVREWMAYDPAFRGGVFVAAGDVTGDGVPDIVTGAGAGGGPHVKVFDGRTGAVVREFMAYDPRFPGGVTVAAADTDFDGQAEVITGAGPGGGPHVEVFSGKDGSLQASFFPYDAAFTGGVYVAALPGVLGGIGIVTGPMSGGGPTVGVALANGLSGAALFLAYDPGFRGGVTVGVAPIGPGGAPAVLTGAGPGGGPHVKAFTASFSPPAVERLSLYAFDPAFTGGVFVG